MTMLVWTDLEATGSNTSGNSPDKILEIGIIVTDETLEEKARWERVVDQGTSTGWLQTLRDNAVVRDMHTKNGLICDVLFKATRNISQIETDLTKFLKPFAEELAPPPNHVMVMAGSGVGHYDLPMMRTWMPYLMQSFAYSTIDVGVIRRSVQMYDPKLAKAAEKYYKRLRPKGKTHRALEDAELHLMEMRYYKEHLFQFKGVKA